MTLHHFRKIRRTLAVFFVINFLSQICFPTISYALTAGPTAPEFSSFEPVDTTDMVNLISGDLTYNLPLLEVPGSSGGYPLSLSYHAGIQPNEEASWVGLGFTLNPGAITRNVNGYPDDHFYTQNVDRTHWVGGNQETYRVGVSVGIANSPASVNGGLSFSNDTYQGFSVGNYYGVGFSAGVNNIGVKMGITWGNQNDQSYTTASMGAGVSNSVAALTAGVSTSSNFGLSGNVGITTVGNNSISASISSSGLKGSLTAGGLSSGVNNARAGTISTKSNGFDVDIPIQPGVNLSLGYNFTRYWSDETATVSTNGALYDPKERILDYDLNAFDTYSILREDADLSLDPDPDMELGGSFPNFDNYYVAAQGLSGSMRPHIFKGLIHRQNKKRENRYFVKQYGYNDNEYRDEQAQFRFINDFSNRYLYEGGEISSGAAAIATNFDNSEVTGEEGNDGIMNSHLAGSRHIEWFTNSEILGLSDVKRPSEYGFLDCHANGFIRNQNKQIGGFMITNESGVSYHYALPVYSKDEIIVTENINQEQGKTGNTLSKPEPYAYQWLLTSVTGPDYVDRNENNKADDGDWGYWVDLAYINHSSDYAWRNPSEDYNSDIDANFKVYSAGSKEVYYLESIRTNSHVAVFNKSSRVDGREVTNKELGGFDPLINSSGDPVYPESSLRLDNIAVYDSKNYDQGKTTENHLLRKIKLNYEYLLCPETPNSYDTSNPNDKLGKLTLMSIDFRGKRGISTTPSMFFEYANDSPLDGSVETSASVSDANEIGHADLYSNQSSFQMINRRDVLKFVQNGQTKYGLVVRKDEDTGQVRIKNIGNSPIVYNTSAENIRKTTNPPYKKDYYDIWNMYDPFISNFALQTNPDSERIPNKNTVFFASAWSLKKIVSSLGSAIEIDYESDDYSTVAIKPTYNFSISMLESISYNRAYLSVLENIDYEEQFSIGSNVEILAVLNDPTECERIVPRPPIKIVAKVVSYYSGGAGIILEWSGFSNVLDFSGCTPSNQLIHSTFLGGHVGSTAGSKFYGGGIRVKQIKITSNNLSRVTSYSYEKLGKSSGTTSYLPNIFSNDIKKQVESQHIFYPDTGSDFEYSGSYEKEYYKSLPGLLRLARELPAPGVMYEQVKVSEKLIYPTGQEIELPNSTVYQFDVFKNEYLDINILQPLTVLQEDVVYDGQSYNYVASKDVVLRDYTSRVGNIQKMTTYFKENSTSNDVKVNEVIYQYLHDDQFENGPSYFDDKLALFKHQGVVQETFIDGRAIAPLLNFRHLNGLITRRHSYPSILTKQTSIDYKSNLKSTSENIAFDFFSGATSQIVSTDSYGIRQLSQTVSAYWNYPQMGLKIYDKNNKHMLTQPAEQYSFLVDIDNNPLMLLSANIQTWSNEVPDLGDDEFPKNIWRKHANYVWNGEDELGQDGFYPYNDFINHKFNWNSNSNPKWLKINETTLYDNYSHALEAIDVNNNYASTRMNVDQTKVMASASNARYGEIAFSGSEYYNANNERDGGVDRGQGSPSNGHKHTGEYSLLVGSGKTGFNYTLTSGNADLTRRYKASVWVYAPGESESQEDLNKIKLYSIINEVKREVHPIIQKSKAKSWYLLSLDIDPNGAPVKIECGNSSVRSVYFDDFRVHPVDASMTSYVYDSFSGELTYILDNNNFYTKFDYDAMGRLIRTSKELLNFDYGEGKESFRADAILKEVKYNYGKSN